MNVSVYHLPEHHSGLAIDLSHVFPLVFIHIGAQGIAVFARDVRPLLDGNGNDSVNNLKLYPV